MQQVEDVYRVGKAPAASPTSVLEEDLSDFMTDWSWEAPPPRAPVSQPATTSSPVCGSPLRSSSSCSDADALQRQQNNNSMPTGPVGSKAGSRSLVETLQKCLTSLPQSTTTAAMSDPAGVTTSSARQSSSRPVGKRRPRASRRPPTTILETNPSDFRHIVQKLTGMPSATTAAVPVRPQPQRANPIRPQTLRSIRRLPPMGPPARASPPLSSPPPPDTTLCRNFSPTRHDENPCHQLQRSSRTYDHVTQPTTVKLAQAYPFLRSCKREFEQTENVDHIKLSDSPPSMAEGSPRSMMKRVMSSMPSWWEHESPVPESRNINLHMTDANPPFAMSTCSSPSSSCYSIDSLAKENLPPSEFVRIDSADWQLAQEEQEFSFSQIESWWSAESMIHG